MNLVGAPLCKPAHAQYETPLEIDAALSQTQQDDVLDEATLHDLDELLVHPVRLTCEDVLRLLTVPWVTPQQIESLRAALPIQSIASWSALPHWSKPQVEQLLPFVAFHAHQSTRAPMDLQADLYDLSSGRRATTRFRGEPLQMAVQVEAPALDSARGYLWWRAPRHQLLIGDMRRTTALGLLWSSRASASSAVGPVASTERWSGSQSLWRDRVVTGLAVRIGDRKRSLDAVGGRLGQKRIIGSTAAVALTRHLRAQVCGLRMDDRQWVSAFLAHGDRQQRVAVEVVRQPRGLSAAILWRRQLRPWNLETLVAVAPDGVSSPLSRAPNSARSSGWTQLRARTAWRNGGILVRGGWTQTQWSAPTVQRRLGYSLQTVARSAALRFEALLRSDTTEDREVDAETLGAWRVAHEQRLLLRLDVPVGNGWFSLQRRSRSRQGGGVDAPRGVGWRLGLHQQIRQSELDLSAAFFEAIAGASIVFSEPAVGPAPALIYGTGSGMRFAARFRHQWRHVGAAVRMAIGWAPQQQWQSRLEAAIRFRPGQVNAF